MVGNRERMEVGVPQPEWLPGLTEALDHLAQDQNRPISAPWAMSVLDRLHNRQFFKLLGDFYTVNPNVTSGETLRRCLSAEQSAIFAAQQDGNFPLPAYPSDAYMDARAWGYVYRWLRTDTQGYGSQYYENMIRRPLTTAVPQREVAARALRRLLPHLFGEEPLWASCGCSIMAGDRLNWLAGHAKGFGFERVDIRSGVSGRASAVSHYKSDLFNGVVEEPDTTRQVVGLDPIDPAEPANLAWNIACATPEEIMSKTWADLRDRIMHAPVPKDYLVFRLADLASRSSMKEIVNEFGRFDGSYASFVYYQGSTAEKRRRMLMNNRDMLVRRSGAIVVADFARIVAKSFLSPLDQWRQPTVFVGYEGLLYPVFRASNGRFRELRVLPGLMALAAGGPHAETVRKLVS